MNGSEHLLVMLSVIVGFAITELLSGVRQLVRARKRLRLHWLPLAWAALLFLVVVQYWWRFFLVVQAEVWSSNIFAFLFLLFSAVLLYLASSSLLPDPTEMDETSSLLDYYMEGRAWVFGLLALYLVVILASEALRGAPPAGLSGAIRLVLLLLIFSLAWSRSVRYHAAATLTGLALFSFFIFSFSLQLTR